MTAKWSSRNGSRVWSNDPSGIGGWLLLLVVQMMIIGPLSGAGAIFGAIASAEIQHPALASSPGWSALKGAIGWTFAVVAALSFYGGLRLTRSRDWSAVKEAVQILWATGPAAAFVLGWIIPRVVFGEASLGDMVSPIAWTSIYAGIWTAYLKKSRRIRNTYDPSFPSVPVAASRDNNSLQSNSKRNNRQVGIHGLRGPYRNEKTIAADAVTPNVLSENALYEIAWNELENKEGDKGLWAKSFSVCDGEVEKAKAYYMKERVNFLSDEQNASFVEYEQRNSETKQRERRQQLLMSFRKKTKAGEYISVADFKAQLIAKGYLVSKFDVDKPDADGRTPLMKAAMNGDVESSLMLLMAGAEKKLMTVSGSTASDLARKEGQEEVAQLIDAF